MFCELIDCNNRDNTSTPPPYNIPDVTKTPTTMSTTSTSSTLSHHNNNHYHSGVSSDNNNNNNNNINNNDDDIISICSASSTNSDVINSRNRHDGLYKLISSHCKLQDEMIQAQEQWRQCQQRRSNNDNKQQNRTKNNNNNMNNMLHSLAFTSLLTSYDDDYSNNNNIDCSTSMSINSSNSNSTTDDNTTTNALTWNDVLKRISHHPKDAGSWIPLDACYDNNSNYPTDTNSKTLPLHAVLSLPYCPLRVIASLINAHPRGVQTRDDRGYLPLHVALRNEYTKRGVFEMLYDAFPGGLAVKKVKTKVVGGEGCSVGSCGPLTSMTDDDDDDDGNDVTESTTAVGLPSLLNDYDSHATILFRHIQSKEWDLCRERLNTHPKEAQIWIMRCDNKRPPPRPPSNKTTLPDDDDAITEIPPSSLVRWRLLPLHAAIIFNAPSSLLSQLIQIYPSGVKLRDDQGNTPLHLATWKNNVNDEVLKLLVDKCRDGCYSMGLMMRDGLRNRVPFFIHEGEEEGGGGGGGVQGVPCMLMNLIKEREWGKCVERLRVFPEEARNWIVKRRTDGTFQWRLMPLHAAIIYKAPYDVIQSLLQTNPQGARCSDDKGMLPLHMAFRNNSCSKDGKIIIDLLLRAHPKGIYVKDRHGRIPMSLNPLIINFYSAHRQQSRRRRHGGSVATADDESSQTTALLGTAPINELNNDNQSLEEREITAARHVSREEMTSWAELVSVMLPSSSSSSKSGQNSCNGDDNKSKGTYTYVTYDSDDEENESVQVVENNLSSLLTTSLMMQQQQQLQQRQRQNDDDQSHERDMNSRSSDETGTIQLQRYRCGALERCFSGDCQDVVDGGSIMTTTKKNKRNNNNSSNIVDGMCIDADTAEYINIISSLMSDQVNMAAYMNESSSLAGSLTESSASSSSRQSSTTKFTDGSLTISTKESMLHQQQQQQQYGMGPMMMMNASIIPPYLGAHHPYPPPFMPSEAAAMQQQQQQQSSSIPMDYQYHPQSYHHFHPYARPPSTYQQQQPPPQQMAQTQLHPQLQQQQQQQQQLHEMMTTNNNNEETTTATKDYSKQKEVDWVLKILSDITKQTKGFNNRQQQQQQQEELEQQQQESIERVHQTQQQQRPTAQTVC